MIKTYSKVNFSLELSMKFVTEIEDLFRLCPENVIPTFFLDLKRKGVSGHSVDVLVVIKIDSTKHRWTL